MVETGCREVIELIAFRRASRREWPGRCRCYAKAPECRTRLLPSASGQSAHKGVFLRGNVPARIVSRLRPEEASRIASATGDLKTCHLAHCERSTCNHLARFAISSVRPSIDGKSPKHSLRPRGTGIRPVGLTFSTAVAISRALSRTAGSGNAKKVQRHSHSAYQLVDPALSSHGRFGRHLAISSLSAGIGSRSWGGRLPSNSRSANSRRTTSTICSQEGPCR